MSEPSPTPGSVNEYAGRTGEDPTETIIPMKTYRAKHYFSYG